jgi:hypothetical protein
LVSGEHLEEGLQAIKTAVQLKPQNKYFRLNMAQLQMRMSDNEGAKKSAEPLLTGEVIAVEFKK